MRYLYFVLVGLMMWTMGCSKPPPPQTPEAPTEIEAEDDQDGPGNAADDDETAKADELMIEVHQSSKHWDLGDEVLVPGPLAKGQEVMVTIYPTVDWSNRKKVTVTGPFVKEERNNSVVLFYDPKRAYTGDNSTTIEVEGYKPVRFNTIVR